MARPVGMMAQGSGRWGLWRVCALFAALSILAGSVPVQAASDVRASPLSGQCARHGGGLAPVAADRLHQMLGAADGCWKVVNFWAGWCAPCRAEMPDLVALQSDRRFHRLRIITVNVDQPGYSDVALRLLRKAGATRTVNVQLDPERLDDFRDSGGVPWGATLPMTLIFDPQGRRAVRQLGVVNMDRLVRYLQDRGA